MTASLKPHLLALLTRRTQQARENATRDLRQLQATVEAIGRAGQMASFSVQLPTEVTANIQKRLNKIRLLTYVLAVEESARGKSQRNAILDAAQQQLTGDIQARKQAAESVQAKIDGLKAECVRKKETLKVEADKERESASRKVRELEAALSVNTTWDWPQPLGIALGIGVVVFVVIGVILWIATLGGWKGSPWASAFQCCGLPILLIGGVVSGARLLWKWSVYNSQDRELRMIDKELRFDFRELDRKLSRTLADFEEPLTSARAREQKARAALGWLQGQQGRTNG